MTGIIRATIRITDQADFDIKRNCLTEMVNCFHRVASNLSDGSPNGLQVRVEPPDMDQYGLPHIHIVLEALNFRRETHGDVQAIEDSMFVFQGKLYIEARAALNETPHGQHIFLGVEYGHFIKQDGP